MHIDANWASSTEDKSTSGCCSIILFTWRSKKQFVVSHSNLEVELRALAQGTFELMKCG